MSKFCFGADMGGTTVKMGLFTTEGELLDKWEIVTDKTEGGKNILSDIANTINDKIAEKNISKDDITGIGLDVPGPVTDDGYVNGCVNVGWSAFNVREALEKLTGFKVRVANDANAAALGEMWQGGGKGHDSIVMVTLGTGVGGGIIINGDIVAGFKGAGGEIGHITVSKDEEDYCNCKRKGCLEQYASATGIVKSAKRFMAKCDTPSPLRDIENVTAKDVLDYAKEGDKLANDIMDFVCDCLGFALSNIACVVDPEAFVIGGGVSKAGKFLLDKISYFYNIYAFDACKDKEFRIATLENDAGIYGCAKMILGK